MEKQGLPVPEAYRQAPDLPADLVQFLDGFFILSPSRQVGFNSYGYIPLTEVESFCRMFDVPKVKDFVEIVRHMDRIFVDYKNKTLPKAKA